MADPEEDDESSRWEHVNGPESPTLGIPRGCLVLVIHPDVIEDAWDTIKAMTIDGLLGHMSSLSPDPIHEGEFENFLTVCVHIMEHKEEEVREILRDHQLSNFIQRFQLNFNENGKSE